MVPALIVLVRARNPMLLTPLEPAARVVRPILNLILRMRNLNPQANLVPLLLLTRPARARLPRLFDPEASRDVGCSAREVRVDGEGLVLPGLDGAGVGVAAAHLARDLLPEPPVFGGAVAYEAGLGRPLGAGVGGLTLVEGVEGHF